MEHEAVRHCDQLAFFTGIDRGRQYVRRMLPVRFYFDFVSPYAYLAWTQIGALATRHGP
jgi:2-hydroxychromene-2-carboxylate isomerase